MTETVHKNPFALYITTKSVGYPKSHSIAPNQVQVIKKN